MQWEERKEKNRNFLNHSKDEEEMKYVCASEERENALIAYFDVNKLHVMFNDSLT